MPNYNDGKIYKLVSNESNDVYIGSTTEKTLARRLAKHKDKYKKWLIDNKKFTSAFDLLKLDNCEIVLIESFPCNSKDELCARERHYIETTPNCINRRKRVILTPEEKREWLSEKKKRYRTKHADEIKEKRKEKYTCECGTELTKAKKSRHEKSNKHIQFINQNK
jgi:hypothetical protein